MYSENPIPTLNLFDDDTRSIVPLGYKYVDGLKASVHQMTVEDMDEKDKYHLSFLNAYESRIDKNYTHLLFDVKLETGYGIISQDCISVVVTNQFVDELINKHIGSLIIMKRQLETQLKYRYSIKNTKYVNNALGNFNPMGLFKEISLSDVLYMVMMTVIAFCAVTLLLATTFGVLQL